MIAFDCKVALDAYSALIGPFVFDTKSGHDPF